MSDQFNVAVYNNADVVGFYLRESALHPAEDHLLKRYVSSKCDIIDVGVGAGGTTPFISKIARRYLGVDYSEAMIEVCKERFPQLDVICADTTKMKAIDDVSFDLAIFSASGIDYISTDAGRINCLRELRRITRPNGTIIISSHNAKALVTLPNFDGARGLRLIWRVIYSCGKTAALLIRNLLLRNSFYRGEGYAKDSRNFGALTYLSTPETIARDARIASLTVIDAVDYRMRSNSKYLIGFYYHVLKRVGEDGTSRSDAKR